MAKIRTLAAAVISATVVTANAATYAPWLTQIGDSDLVQATANHGKGISIGIVDTGILATDIAFAKNQVNTALSSCAGVTFSCGSSGSNDVTGVGHGTAVAAIAASGLMSPYSNISSGGYTTKNGDVLGMATGATIVAERVFGNLASYTTAPDMANGIRKATDAGVSVINLSLTVVSDPGVTAAINYAASKGVFIVWAAGNDAKSLFSNSNSLSGLSSAAISHLVFVGSVNSSNKLSSFSNSAGTGSIVDTTGKLTAYSSRFIDAGGENIIAPYSPAGANAMAYWTGTSMATPLVSGSLALLESAWPILKTNGTAANLLLSTATNLGDAKIYGVGLTNLAAAFSPVGSLTAKQVNGQTIAISNLTGTLLAGGALGNLASIQSLLANYTAFDSYSRNFTVNLSGLIKTVSPSSVSQSSSGSTVPTSSVKKLAFSDQYDHTWAWSGNPNTALYSNELAQSFETLNTGISNLARGGTALAIGTKLSDDHRLAVSFSDTENHYTRNLGVSLSQRIQDDFTTAIQFGMLNEQNALLGSNIGNSKNTSYSFGVSAVYHFDDRNSFILDTGYSLTSDNTNSSGLIAGTTGIVSQSYGAAWVINGQDDRLMFSLQQPLRVTNGYASILVASTNDDGSPKYATQLVQLTPSGREIVYGVNYSSSLTKESTFAVKFAYHQDFNNISGMSETELGVAYKRQF